MNRTDRKRNRQWTNKYMTRNATAFQFIQVLNRQIYMWALNADENAGETHNETTSSVTTSVLSPERRDAQRDKGR
jgi:hypothetical protein